MFQVRMSSVFSSSFSLGANVESQFCVISKRTQSPLRYERQTFYKLSI